MSDKIDVDKMLTKGKYIVEYETHVPVSPEEAHDIVNKHVWVDGGFPFPVSLLMGTPKIASPAKDKAGNGSVRYMPNSLLPLMGEHCVSAEHGKYFLYQVKSGPLPVSYHCGCVRFYPTKKNHTLITWTVNYTPYFGLEMFNRYFMFNPMFPMFLWTAKREAQKKAKVPVDSGMMSYILWIVLALIIYSIVSKLMIVSSAVPLHPADGYLSILNNYYESTPDLTQFAKDTSFLIIGGTGFTGSSIVHELRTRGAKSITILGRSLPPGVEYPYGPSKSDRYPLPGVKYISGDVTSIDVLKKAMDGVDVVFHTAAMYGSPTFGYLEGGEITEKTNFGGMKNILQAAADKKVKQIIYTSSCDTVFSGRHIKNANETLPYASLGVTNQSYATGDFAVGDHYARTKIMAEKLLLESHSKNEVLTLSLRPNGIYGPGENVNFPKAIVPAWLMSVWPIYFDLEQTIDWTCVGSLAASHIHAAYKLGKDPKVGGRAYFITDDDKDMDSASFGIFKPMAEALGVPVLKWFWVPAWVIRESAHGMEVGLHKLKQLTGISIAPFLTKKEGLKATITHTHDNTAIKTILGFQNLMTTAECQKWAAEEMARRYKVIKG